MLPRFTRHGGSLFTHSKSDEEANLYYKYYAGLSIGDKYLCVVVKFKQKDAFVITAYFTDRRLSMMP